MQLQPATATTTECYISFISTNINSGHWTCGRLSYSLHHNYELGRYFNLKSFAQKLLFYHEIRVGQIHRCPTRPKIRVGLVLHVPSYTVPAPTRVWGWSLWESVEMKI